MQTALTGDIADIRKGIPLSDESAFLRKFSTQTVEAAPASPSGTRIMLWWLLKALVVFLCGLSLYLLYTFSLDRSLFQLNNVVLQGCRHLDRNEVLSLVHSAFPRNLMKLDTQELMQRVEKYNWVRSVTVRKVYPDKLFIRIVEREPIGVARLDKLWLFDESGIFLDEYRPSEHTLDRPVLTGLREASDPLASDENLERIRRYLEFLREIDGGGANLSAQISEIDLTDLADLVIIPMSGMPRVHLGHEDLCRRLQRFYNIIERATQESGPISEVNMRYDDKIIFIPMKVE